jgi:hypothetical protein
MRRLIPSTFNEVVALCGVFGAIATFIFGIIQWREQAIRTEETRRIEATKPFLERQLKLYTEASQIVAVLATAEDPGEKRHAYKRFRELYWGEMVLVENEDVERAMVNVKDAIERHAGQGDLQSLSLNLAHACRHSLARSWGVDVWARPDQAGTSGKP